MRKIAAIGLVALLSGVTVTGNAAEPVPARDLRKVEIRRPMECTCLLYTSDAADE